jgi:colanic acid/amylovoran biosynthesis glycosyltransferase
MTAHSRQNLPMIAYLNSEYPSLSHTFIERGIRGLRVRGFQIQPFSARSSASPGDAGTVHHAAAAETIVLQTGPVKMAATAAASFVRSPLSCSRALIAAQRFAPPGLGSRARHVAYAIQAIILGHHSRRLGFSHVHVHMANNGAAIALLAAIARPGLTYSLSIHGSAEFFHVDTWTLAPKAEQALFVRCISNFCKAQVMAWTAPSAWKRFEIVRCGVDLGVFAPRRPRDSGPLRLLTVGRLHPIKGYDLLLQACRTLADEGLPFELTMVGDGPLMSSLRDAICRLDLSSRVQLVGPVQQEHIQSYYDRADAMVMSSFMEGVPVVLMEAMAKELGVVATRVGGIPELVEHQVSGLLVDAGSAAALAEGIRQYAADPGLCRKHGMNGRAAVLQSYSVDHTAEGMAELFGRNLAAPVGEVCS